MPAVLVDHLAHLTQLTKALGDETRLRIMGILYHDELCACQIVEVFALANSTISKHLSLLKQSGLLSSRKSGRWIYYAWAKSPNTQICLTQDWLKHVLIEDIQIIQDRQRVQEICKIDPEELCRRQNGRSCCP